MRFRPVAGPSQRLVRKVCPYCSTSKQASSAEVLTYQQEIGEPKTEFLYGRGCNFCSHTGFLGRIGVFELTTMDESIRKLVMKAVSAAELKSAAIDGGMITMRRDGMLKAKDGVTTISEVVRNVFTIL